MILYYSNSTVVQCCQPFFDLILLAFMLQRQLPLFSNRGKMVFLVSLLLQLSIPGYSVAVDPSALEYLYDHYQENSEIPATITLDSITVDCTLSFRGAVSVHLEKKGWHIRLEESEAFPCGEHLLLNAQFLDPSLMRNTLGHLLTRELGYPAPLTEFVTLSINGTNYGVYEQIERVDRRFLERNGFGYGPLFKSYHTLGRLVCHYTHFAGTHSFEPKIDSDPYKQQLLELIEDCFRGDISSLCTDEFIALLAVKTAISNRDGVIKNFYLHLWQDQWHVYPWDRDASFGNSPGEYIPEWYIKNSLDDISRFGATRALFESWENVQMFNSLIERSAEIMGSKFSHVVDSIRLDIRDELAVDPFYEFSSFQFDSICTVLAEDIEARASFLSTVYLADTVSAIVDYEIPSSLDLQGRFDFSLALEGGDPHGVILLLSVDGGEEEICFLPEQADDIYEFNRLVPQGTYSVRIAFGPRVKPVRLPVFFPSWAFKNCNIVSVPAPGARMALGALEPDLFSTGSPLWCGENLWVLPVSNDAGFTQDLSLCCFRIGSPSGTIFFPESVLVEAGETFYLTNNAFLAGKYYTGQIFGDAGSPYPVNTELILDDPSWHEMHRYGIGIGDSTQTNSHSVIPSELSVGNSEDWVELYNSGDEAVDLSGWFLKESDMNISVFRENTVLGPHQFLLISEDPLPIEYGSGTEAHHHLNFSLNQSNDSLKLFNRLGTEVFSMGWDSSWPCDETGIIYLKSPEEDYHTCVSWSPTSPPGTPSTPNPGWNILLNYTDIRLISENPSNGTFSIEYQSSSEVLEAVLFDLSGRVVSNLDLQETISGVFSADFSSTLSSGIYFVYLRSSTGSDSVTLTVLAGE